ncbi:hypothetical protein [Bacillus pseudomycoides]|uniref:hypothetical protein n=1 Tax=Bacillus pseudomycoides TaxID=64104 RepID=UPI001FB42D03|nr:hypothetical protein [Bacillus pseudomycoides]
MTKIKIMCSLLVLLLLLTSCDISDKEIEKKAQAYVKSQYGIAVKLNQVETHGDGKNLFGPETRTAYVKQVERPNLEFQLKVDGQISPKVTNDNYKLKKEANNLLEKYKKYNAKLLNNNIFSFDQMETGNIVFDKKIVEEAAKKNSNHYFTAVFKSNVFLDLNNPSHMEELAQIARNIQSFNKTIEQSKCRIEDMNIILPDVDEKLIQNLMVDYVLTAEEAKKTLEKRDDYVKILQVVK